MKGNLEEKHHCPSQQMHFVGLSQAWMVVGLLQKRADVLVDGCFPQDSEQPLAKRQHHYQSPLSQLPLTQSSH